MIKNILNVYRKIVPEKIRREMNIKYKSLFSTYREQKRKFGARNTDKVFYVIRNMTDRQGILNNWIEVARKVDYSLNKGYIPIVDFKNYYRKSMIDESKKNICNSWEIYFRQPFPEYSLEEVYKSKNVILSCGQDVYEMTNWPNYKMKDECQKYHQLYKNLIGFNTEFMEHLEKEKNKYIPSDSNVLGISMRRELEHGNMLQEEHYVKNNVHTPKNNLEQIKDEIEKYMEKFKCQKFLFTCDDFETCIHMKEIYGNKIIIYDRVRTRFFENGQPRPYEVVYKECVGNVNQMAIDYLTETYLLAHCNSLVGIETTSNTMACIINNYSYDNIV